MEPIPLRYRSGDMTASDIACARVPSRHKHKYYYTNKGGQTMLFNEFFDADKVGDWLTNLIDFVSNDGETGRIRQWLLKKGIKPT